MLRFILVKCCHAHTCQKLQQIGECYEINLWQFLPSQKPIYGKAI